MTKRKSKKNTAPDNGADGFMFWVCYCGVLAIIGTAFALAFTK